MARTLKKEGKKLWKSLYNEPYKKNIYIYVYIELVYVLYKLNTSILNKKHIQNMYYNEANETAGVKCHTLTYVRSLFAFVSVSVCVSLFCMCIQY